MNDLAAQLRDYIDGIAEPVPLEETRGIVETSSVTSPQKARRAVALAIAAIVVIALVVGASRLWSGTNNPTITPAGSPGVALRPVGPTDCSAKLAQGDTLLVATRLSHGHSICITKQSYRTTVYFDGHQEASTSSSIPLGEQQVFLSGFPSGEGTTVYVGNLPDAAHSLRLSFCDGKTLDLFAINHASPRFVAAIVNTTQYGLPGSQLLDSAGHAAGPTQSPPPPTFKSQSTKTPPIGVGPIGPLTGTITGQSCKPQRPH